MDSNKLCDITDDEIRIISSSDAAPMEPGGREPRRRGLWLWLCAALLTALGTAAGWLLLGGAADAEDPAHLPFTPATDTLSSAAPPLRPDGGGLACTLPDAASPRGFVQICDTLVHKVPLTILTPHHAVPRLHVGADVLQSEDVLLVLQAADVRRDNGQIVGTYVSEGRLLSRGQSKSGFCAIIGGRLTIGVADATPYLEQALENEGYFFRQYPLVVGRQVVENKPKGKALRKALAELNGETVVVMSRVRMTFNDFAQTLVSLGVANAIYLVGSEAYGFAIARDGHRVEIGVEQSRSSEFTNYIVWQ